MKLTVTFHPQALHVTIVSPVYGVSTGVPVARELVERDPFEGPYTVTPSEQEQTLSTKHLRMTDDITVAAIPSNYGLISWDGSSLSVS